MHIRKSLNQRDSLVTGEQGSLSTASTANRYRISVETGALDVAVAGPEDGTPLVFHHGSPGSLMLFEPFIEAALARGLRYVSYSRPGYGSSSRQAGRKVADCSEGTASIMDQLGADRFFTIGWSGGGPHALACAALLPQRVIAASSIASPAPYLARNLDWQAGQERGIIEKVQAALSDPDKLQSLLEQEEPKFANLTGDQIIAALGDLPDVDKAVLSGPLGAFLAENIREACRNGIWGLFDDNIAFVHDWGFDLSRIEVPIAVWHGAQDRMVPFAHGQWLADNVPNAQARLLPEHGHLSIVIGAFNSILDNLIDSGKR